MILTLIYYASFIGGCYFLFWKDMIHSEWSVWLSGLTIIASFMSGMQWGECVEKCQGMWRVWRKTEGGQHY